MTGVAALGLVLAVMLRARTVRDPIAVAA